MDASVIEGVAALVGVFRAEGVYEVVGVGERGHDGGHRGLC